MLENDFTKIKLIGRGAFGEVHLTKKKDSSLKYATKTIDKKKYSKNEKAKSYLENELAILKEISHPNIVKLIEIQETLNYYHVITEYCNGGNLSTCLENYQKIHNRAFPEDIVQHIMRQLMDAMNYLHEKGILHRDLKLDNILINYDDENDRLNNNIIKGKIKLIDFGFARHFNREKKELATSALGTPMYMDPGILQKYNKMKNFKDYTYDEKADIWSLGIICYELLVGKSAYDSETMKELLEKVRKGTYYLPNNLSKEAISFLNCMIQFDPKRRLSAKSLLSHKFLKNDVKKFNKINFDDIKKNIKGSKIRINSIVNQSIWDIFGDGMIDSIMEISDENDTDGEDELNKEKELYVTKCNSLTSSVFQNDNNLETPKSPPKILKKKDNLEEMIWKAFNEINFDSISIEPKFAPFIPGMDLKILNVDII